MSGIELTFRFKANYEGQPTTVVTHETDAITVDDILQEFSEFLAGCGYAVKPGSIVIAEEDDGPVTFGKESKCSYESLP